MSRWERLRARFWRRPRLGVQVTVPTLRLGSAYGGYVVCPQLLSPASVVYSVGVGEDVSFDLALIHEFGVTVHAFDPTPRSLAWARGQALPSRFVLHPFGIAASQGTARFMPPVDPTHVSHRLFSSWDASPRALPPRFPSPIEVPVRRLAAIMAELGHGHLDLLKLDIEGAECEVLEDMMACGVSVGQVLVEFHHRLKGVGLARTERTIELLLAQNYRVFYRSEDGVEFSFLHRLGSDLP